MIEYNSMAKYYNYFIDFIKPYIKGRYPFDYFRGSSDNNLSKDLAGMKRHK